MPAACRNPRTTLILRPQSTLCLSGPFVNPPALSSPDTVVDGLVMPRQVARARMCWRASIGDAVAVAWISQLGLTPLSVAPHSRVNPVVYASNNGDNTDSVPRSPVPRERGTPLL